LGKKEKSGKGENEKGENEFFHNSGYLHRKYTL
jgi:hypothetical protein